MRHITGIEIFDGLATLCLGAPEDMPSWAQEKVHPLLVNKAFRLLGRSPASQIPSVAQAQAVLLTWAEEVADAMIEARLGYYRVKVGKGKTEASRKVTIEIFKDHNVENSSPHCSSQPLEKSQVQFYAPTSMIHEDEKGQSWLPAYFVGKKLEEKSARSIYRKDRYLRSPCQKQEWAHKQGFLDLHLSQLPTQETVTAHLEAKAAERSARKEKERIESEMRQKAAQEERVVRESAEAVARHKAEVRKAQARDKMEKHEGVNVKWIEWIPQGKGQYPKKVEETAENVTLFITGSRTYIVFSNGDEIIKKSSNVEIL